MEEKIPLAELDTITLFYDDSTPRLNSTTTKSGIRLGELRQSLLKTVQATLQLFNPRLTHAEVKCLDTQLEIIQRFI